jgi:hypothetical protein
MTTDSPGPDVTDVYTRCPDCGFIAPPSSMDYAIAAGGGIDWDSRVEVRCMICHAVHSPGPGDVLPMDDAMTCKRCQASAPCPAGAARVRCPGCGLFLTGHQLTGRQREELRIAEGLAGLALRERWLAAKEAARRAGTLPPYLDTTSQEDQ